MLTDWATFGSGVVVIVAALAGLWFKFLRPRLHRAGQFLGRIDETINGRAETRDHYGKLLAPAVPALADRVGELTDVVRELVSHREDLDSMKAAVDAHENRITRLESAAVERVVTKAESAAAWRAVEAVAQRDPDETND